MITRGTGIVPSVAMTPPPEFDLPKGLVEPARVIGNVILAVTAAVGVIVGVAGAVLPSLPPAWHSPIVAVISASSVAAGALSRFAAGLIRGHVVPFEKHKAEVAAAASAALRQP